MKSCIMYHGIGHKSFPGQVSLAEFRRQIQFLRGFGEFVGLDEYVASRNFFGRPKFLLTFDDGYANNAQIVAPVLEELGVPALFFVSTAHCDSDDYLWFSHLDALKRHYRDTSLVISGRKYSMVGPERNETLRDLEKRLIDSAGSINSIRTLLSKFPSLSEYVSSATLEESYKGMSQSQLKDLSENPLFEVGAHTENHLFLSRASAADVNAEIMNSVKFIESATGKAVRCFAYPSGDYSLEVLDRCKGIFEFSFSVYRSLKGDAAHEMQRFGIYSPSLITLLTKLALGRSLRSLGKSIG